MLCPGPSTAFRRCFFDAALVESQLGRVDGTRLLMRLKTAAEWRRNRCVLAVHSFSIRLSLLVRILFSLLSPFSSEDSIV